MAAADCNPFPDQDSDESDPEVVGESRDNHMSSGADDGDNDLDFIDDGLSIPPSGPPPPPPTQDSTSQSTISSNITVKPFDSDEDLRRNSIRWTKSLSIQRPPSIPIRPESIANPDARESADSAPQPTAASDVSSTTNDNDDQTPPSLPEYCPEPRAYIAVAPFTPRYYDELLLGVGELVMVTRQPEGGWWFGHTRKTAAGKDEGWFPTNHVGVPPWGKVISVKVPTQDCPSKRHVYHNLELGNRSDGARTSDGDNAVADIDEVKGIEAQIENWVGEPLHKQCSRLIFDGALLQMPMSSDGSQPLLPKRYGRHFFLFDTMLIWCKRIHKDPTAGGIFRLKGMILIQNFNIMVPSTVQSSEFKVRHSWIVYFSNANKIFRCIAPTETLKNKWVSSFEKIGVNVMGLRATINPATDVHAGSMKTSDELRIEVMEEVKLGKISIDQALAKIQMCEREEERKYSESSSPTTRAAPRSLYDDE